MMKDKLLWSARATSGNKLGPDQKQSKSKHFLPSPYSSADKYGFKLKAF